jgi:hypothetical protein
LQRRHYQQLSALLAGHKAHFCYPGPDGRSIFQLLFGSYIIFYDKKLAAAIATAPSHATFSSNIHARTIVFALSSLEVRSKLELLFG